MKIYGDSLQPDVPYKTLLLSTADTTSSVIKEALEKYGLEKEEPEHFVLVMVSALTCDLLCLSSCLVVYLINCSANI